MSDCVFSITDLISSMAEGARGMMIDNLSPKIMDIIDLDALKIQVDEIMEFLFVVKRFRKLSKMFDGKLACHQDCFEIEGHKFQTLDEVEKCYNNRAFL